jgi:beta-lactamase class A
MKKLFLLVALPLAICFAPINLCAQNKNSESQAKNSVSQKYSPPVFEEAPALQNLVNQAASETINKFSEKNFKPNNLAITLIDLRDPNKLKMAHFNGDIKIYPASVVKMFYLAAVHRWLEDGKIKDTPELRRGMKDMIVDSSNDATHYMVDALTGTSSGAELSPEELKEFALKRNAVNRFFESLGYQNINVNQKTYCEDIYGRERQFWDGGKQRNMLTTNATARLLAEIALGRMVTAERSGQMMELMKRDFSGETKDPDNQAHGFTGIALKNLKDARLWSKAGWTSTTRHDAAYVETPDNLKFVLVTFTTSFANEREIIPSIARIVLNNLGGIK